MTISVQVHNPHRPPNVTMLPLAISVICDDTMVRVSLADGREIAVPLHWHPRLHHATPEQRTQWELIGNGTGIHWEAIDEDISVASLLGLPSD